MKRLVLIEYSPNSTDRRQNSAIDNVIWNTRYFL